MLFNKTREIRMRTLIRVFLVLFIISGLAGFTCGRPAPISPKSSITEIGDTGKYLMHLEGTPYQIGYAIGHFRPDDVVKLCHGDYVVNVLNLIMPSLGITDVEATADGLDLLLRIKAIQDLLDLMAADVPDEYREEMRGIADGTNAALGKKSAAIKPVTYHHVLLVNFLPAMQYLLTSDLVASLLSSLFESCQGFIAFGDATIDGRALMGRHFMWTPDPLDSITCLAEYVPRRGRRFVAVTFPGMVGVITGLNSTGIGVGSNMFRASDRSGFPGGIGMWLLDRKLLQYSGSMADAEAMIREADETAPCFYIIGDAAGAGAVFEVYDHRVSARYADWISYDAAAPDPIEAEDDLVVVTNHAFTPEMYPIDDCRPGSAARYGILTGLLLDAYGTLDPASGREIIDYMHPPSPYHIGYDTDYSTDPTQSVQQHVVLMDLSERTISALYGHYNDPWVFHTLE
ncbi:MAG: hypothetical protein JW807_08200 [Spirochaetes bacterium]|nr:hypothetical protein [Spirochaetota bacterium]